MLCYIIWNNAIKYHLRCIVLDYLESYQIDICGQSISCEWDNGICVCVCGGGGLDFQSLQSETVLTFISRSSPDVNRCTACTKLGRKEAIDWTGSRPYNHFRRRKFNYVTVVKCQSLPLHTVTPPPLLLPPDTNEKLIIMSHIEFSGRVIIDPSNSDYITVSE